MSHTKSTRKTAAPSGLIFVVDDNALLVEFAGTVLKGEGYEVRIFTDPKAALQAMEEADPKPVALVTDYEMGEMNGLQLIESSHKINPSLKTVLLSGTIDGSFISGHPAKVDRFLGKPYLPPQLKSTLGELLRA
ncbi:MAG: response regulator [Limisphaerales bacterium]